MPELSELHGLAHLFVVFQLLHPVHDHTLVGDISVIGRLWVIIVVPTTTLSAWKSCQHAVHTRFTIDMWYTQFQFTVIVLEWLFQCLFKVSSERCFISIHIS